MFKKGLRSKPDGKDEGVESCASARPHSGEERKEESEETTRPERVACEIWLHFRVTFGSMRVEK